MAIKPGVVPFFARAWSAEMGAYDETFGGIYIRRGRPTEAWCMAHWPSAPAGMREMAHGR